MRKMRFNILMMMLFVVLGESAWSATVSGLYAATVPMVEKLGRENREEAMQRALQAVLVKVTGDVYVAMDKSIQANLAKAPELAQQFSYKKVREAGTLREIRALEVQFNRDAVNQLLMSASKPIWGEDRPLLLVWMAVGEDDNPTHYQLMGGETETSATRLLLDDAQFRGLPIMLPLLDIDDMAALSPSDVWISKMVKVRQASKRYLPDGLVLVKVYPQAGRWHGDWVLRIGGRQRSWLLQGDTLNEVMQAGIDKLTSILVTQSSNPPSLAEQQQFYLKIVDVDDFKAYSDVMHYLRGLSAVGAVNVMSTDADSVLVSVNVMGGRKSLLRTLEVGHKLYPLEEHPVGRKLTFRWSP